MHACMLAAAHLVTPTNQPSTAPCSAMLLTSAYNSKKLICKEDETVGFCSVGL